MYIAQTPHIDPLMFHLALQQNAETDAVDGAEKTAFAWWACFHSAAMIAVGTLLLFLDCTCATCINSLL